MIFYNQCCKCNVWIQSTIEFTNTLRNIHKEAISTNRGAGMYGDMMKLSLPNFDRSFLIYFHFNRRNFMMFRIWPQSSFKTFRRPCRKAFTYQNFVLKWSYLTSRLWSIFKKSFSQTSGSVKVVRVYISKEERKAFPSPPTVVDALPVRTSWCTVSAAPPPFAVPPPVTAPPSPRCRRSPRRPPYSRPPAAMTAATGLASWP